MTNNLRFINFNIDKTEILRKKKFEFENNIKKIINYKKRSKPFILKENYNSIIPLDLYTCWHTKDLPPLMLSNYNLMVESNPKINFHLYDENECREFIKNNFAEDVLIAYNSLIPCSYKSDLWRYCILYKNGGIYMDIKYKPVNGFKFISLTEKEYFVRDYHIRDTYTALIVALPGNRILFNCIRQIVDNVKNKYYGKNSLAPTGPALLGSYFTQEEKNSLEMYHDCAECINKYYIVKDDTLILQWYDGYRDEQLKNQKLNHYSVLWNARNIYK